MGDTLRRSHLGKATLLFALLFLAVSFVWIGLTPQAGAATSSSSWGPRDSFYNNIKRVTGQGTFSNSAGTFTSKVTVTDRIKDGNTTYAQTTFLYKAAEWDNASGGYVDRWNFGPRKSTAEYADAKNVSRVGSVKYYAPSHGDAVRGQISACAQMTWPIPDNCTTPALLTLTY